MDKKTHRRHFKIKSDKKVGESLFFSVLNNDNFSIRCQNSDFRVGNFFEDVFYFVRAHIEKRGGERVCHG